ncbi:UbiA family prenyltransferase [Neptunicoccus cionae]|uniref:Prenyltransferase n=1 Tax=Neptunicoccus cionae TaxID=2035344 RepID=A0A916VPA2_9RHOB|nr:UbiA family prenyltransferase [Amylibacter cionae]GGA14214.1 prenyltransferase [Amylibacter cionae]
MTNKRPLAVDIDGTFLKTDMLFEGFWLALGKQPLKTIKTVFSHFNDRARLKREITELADVNVELLPVNPDIQAYMEEARAEGREVIFASASDTTLVQRLADYHGVEGDHIGSDGAVNLKGEAKAAALNARFGEGQYAYAGDQKLDSKVWRSAGEAIVVGRHPSVVRQLKADGVEVVQVKKSWSRRSLAMGLRPHQWVKNALLFLPLIAAHSVDPLSIMRVILAIAAFSAAASSIYIVNDLLDLEADRQHPKKQFRPLASGNARIPDAMLMSFALGVFALGVGYIIGWALLGVIALYMLLSLSYSLKLKKMRWVDIATLAALYTLRVIAGGLAAQVTASGWLVGLIFPTFLALGCVKRLTELTLAKSDGKVPGRGYRKSDREDLVNVAGLGVFFSLLVFLMYTFSGTAATLYQDIWMLRLAIIPLALWQIRMVLLGWQGKQDYDPIVFAMRDKSGVAIIAVTVLIMFYAAGKIV